VSSRVSCTARCFRTSPFLGHRAHHVRLVAPQHFFDHCRPYRHRLACLRPRRIDDITVTVVVPRDELSFLKLVLATRPLVRRARVTRAPTRASPVVGCFAGEPVPRRAPGREGGGVHRIGSVHMMSAPISAKGQHLVGSSSAVGRDNGAKFVVCRDRVNRSVVARFGASFAVPPPRSWCRMLTGGFAALPVTSGALVSTVIPTWVFKYSRADAPLERYHRRVLLTA
jgi:hypothetical protein